MRISRIDKKSKVVLNLEECEEEWLSEDDQKNSKDFIFVVDESDEAVIGYFWNGTDYVESLS